MSGRDSFCMRSMLEILILREEIHFHIAPLMVDIVIRDDILCIVIIMDDSQ